MMLGYNNHSNYMSGNKAKSVTNLDVNGISAYFSLSYHELPQKNKKGTSFKDFFKKETVWLTSTIMICSKQRK